MSNSYPRIGQFRTFGEFAAHLRRIDAGVPLEETVLSAAEGSPLAEPIVVGGFRVGNRWCVHPMEGWDATEDGRPTENTLRRWRHFGQSGAKLIWGGEAVAVRRDGRANPNQLYAHPAAADSFARLLNELTAAHVRQFGPAADDDLLVGLQLTHSGRFCRPNRHDRLEPRIAYHHPVLDRRVNIRPDDGSVVLTDDDLRQLVDDYVAAAKMAHRAGFRFVDVKHCHGYLGHELLSAFDRPGRYGGSLQNRARLLGEVIEGVRAECPGMMIGVRLSLFDLPAFQPDPQRTGGGKFGPGVPLDCPLPYPGFGCRRDDPMQVDLAEPIRLLEMLRDDWRVEMVNLSAGSPYYNPHVQRPAYYPPSDGYQPPEDPLVGCVRQIRAVHEVKQAVPGLPIVGTAYSYFQDFLPNVAQAVVRQGWADLVGLGRMVLCYWDLPADVLAGTPLATKRICRTFSDCTTAPRSGLPSGCFPLDSHYKTSPEAAILKQAKAELRDRLRSLEGGSPG